MPSKPTGPSDLSIRRSLGIAAVVVLALMTVSCSGSAPEIPLGPDGQADEVLGLGRDVWTAQCSSCHGANGQGGRGKKLNDGQIFVLHPDIDTMLEVIRAGKGRGMPAFGDELTAEEIEAVARYTREVLN